MAVRQNTVRNSAFLPERGRPARLPQGRCRMRCPIFGRDALLRVRRRCGILPRRFGAAWLLPLLGVSEFRRVGGSSHKEHKAPQRKCAACAERCTMVSCPWLRKMSPLKEYKRPSLPNGWHFAIRWQGVFSRQTRSSTYCCRLACWCLPYWLLLGVFSWRIPQVRPFGNTLINNPSNLPFCCPLFSSPPFGAPSTNCALR